MCLFPGVFGKRALSRVSGSLAKWQKPNAAPGKAAGRYKINNMVERAIAQHDGTAIEKIKEVSGPNLRVRRVKMLLETQC
jgi:hypothetical protein